MARCLLLALIVLCVAAAHADAVLVYVRHAPMSGSNYSPPGPIVVAHDDGSHPRVVAHGIYALVSPDGRKLVYSTQDLAGNSSPDPHTVATSGGRSELLLRRAGGYVEQRFGGPRWSPNGRYLIAEDPDKGVDYLFDFVRHSTQQLAVLTGYNGVSFSSDSKTLAFEVPDLRTRYLTFYDIRRQKYFGNIDNAGMPAWGRAWLAFSRDSVGLGYVPTPAARPVRLAPSGALPLAWSSDGHRLLAEDDTSTPGHFRALVIAPHTRAVAVRGTGFSEVDGLSRDGKAVLGVIDGNVVRVIRNAETRILARGALSASWTR